jgi:hypothetical protein
MKKIAALLMVGFLIAPGIAVALDYPVLDNQVETRRRHLTWLLTLQEISMEAVHDYIDEISDGAGAGRLETILDEYREALADIDSYDTHVGLNNYIRSLRDVTTGFREETRERLRQYDGSAVVLLIRIAERIDDDSERLERLKDEYWESKNRNTLANFDIRLERAQNVLDLLEERGYDVSEAQAKLDEIAALRDELEAALVDQDNAEILSVSLEALELSRQLADHVRDLQVQVPVKRILQHWVNVGERILDRTDTIIDELGRLGLDTGELEEIHGEAEDHLALAVEKLDEEDYEAAADALHDLKDSLMELREAYLDLVFPEGFPEELEDAMGTMAEKLEDLADNMQESLETL